MAFKGYITIKQPYQIGGSKSQAPISLTKLLNISKLIKLKVTISQPRFLNGNSCWGRFFRKMGFAYLLYELRLSPSSTP